MIKFLFIILSFVLNTSKGVEIECNYRRTGWNSVVGSVDSCWISNLNVTTPTEEVSCVTRSKNENNPQISNSGVEGIIIDTGTCFYLPNSFDKHFDNIIALLIQIRDLKEIKNSDLKQFPKLKLLAIKDSGNLETLDSDLFFFNENIEALHIERTSLKHVGSYIFEPLINSVEFVFERNTCIDGRAKTKEKIAELKKNIIQKCPPSKEMARIEVAHKRYSNINTNSTTVPARDPTFLMNVYNLIFN